MKFKKFFILFFVSISLSKFATAQQTPVKTDSTQLYKNIESYSRRSKFRLFIYRSIFKPGVPTSKNKIVKKRVYKKLIQKPYSAFEGKIIRNIDIVTLDPFGYSINDTNVVAQNILYRAGNEIHIKTHYITIRNLMLIHKNEPFNSLRVKESERLIRSQNYVHDVSFYVGSKAGKSDSVDIFIRELDKWSIIPLASISTSSFKIGIGDNNFLGFGHEFQNAYSRNFTNRINAFKTNYYIPNIRNTYINTAMHYEVDGYKNLNKSLVIDRPFYSPLAKWAAGASFASQYRRDSLKDVNSIYVPFYLKFRTQDYWGGVAQRIFKGSSEKERVINLILALRYLHIRYSEKPSELIDPLHIYSNEDFYLAGIGISAREYVQDKYIFKYGVIEDVPVGNVFELTGGYQVKNNSGRLYLGMRYSSGNYYEWGYLSSNFEYGTFLRSSHAEQGVVKAGINYFTGLIEIGRWKFRQFVKPQVTIGLNRFSYDSLTLNDGYGLDGFNSPSLKGTSRLLLSLQTQSYSPWNFLGFHFGPYFICSLGMLGDAVKGFKNSKMYSQIGLGVLIKNENLVISTFQFSISFYPIIPGNGQDVFRMNSFRTTDFGFRDFEIGKPAITVFR
jgi:hypothetical protein